MKLLSRIQSTLRNLFRKRRIESQLDEEVHTYVDMMTEEKIAAGMSESEARRTAMLEFGGVEQVKQAVREHRAGAGIESLWQDVRYGLRQLRRNRAFTLTAVITLGLGIGATTAIFSAVYALLLRPLPYHDSNRLMNIAMDWPKTHAHVDVLISPDFVAAQSETKSFEQFAGYIDRGNANLTGTGDPLRIIRFSVTANLFPTLGVVPQIGRNFSQNEDRIGGPPVILLSDRLWRNKFHADPGVVGQTITLDGTRQTIIGVLPAHFIFPDPGAEPDIYMPADLDPDTNLAVSKSVFAMAVIARLRPGLNMQQAQAEMQAFFLARAKSYPAEFAPWSDGRQMIVEPLQRYLTGDDRNPLYVLLFSVATVLLIACANVANLQLARAVSRRHETALRGALGASRLRLVRQFLVESLLLSSLAAGLGLIIAFVVTSSIRHAGTLEESQISLHSHIAQLLRLPFGKLSAAIQLDGWVLAFTVGLALLTTLLFGLAPAISGTRTDLRNALQTAALHISSGREQRWLRHFLLVVEVGLAVVLLASAGLLVRSFVNVLHYDSGFDPSNMLTGTTLLRGERYSLEEERIRSFVDQLLPRLKALPAVKAAAVASALPLGPVAATTIRTNAMTPASTSDFTNFTEAYPISVTPDYFRTVHTTILRGRGFSTDDNETSPRVAIVNRAFAKQFFAGDALGKRFERWAEAHKSPNQFSWLTIVGIADNVRHGGLEQEVQPVFFVPMYQFPNTQINIVLRTANDPALLANAMRHAVTEVDPQQPVFDIQTMDQRVSDLLARRRLIMLLIACFAMLAVVLSAVGVYGVFAYSVTQRSHEMGIRLALGASRSGLVRLVVMQAARLIMLGGILGIGAALALSRLLASLLVGVRPHDALSFSLAWLLMTVVALLASAIPAAHAARTDVVSVLHSE